ncbi:hypothetical protein EV426DRAFT_708214 [Tirmania nivea]|nr:hypothetical protein EV426DRAFT_708214 [Tirmania nivea]
MVVWEGDYQDRTSLITKRVDWDIPKKVWAKYGLPVQEMKQSYHPARNGHLRVLKQIDVPLPLPTNVPPPLHVPPPLPLNIPPPPPPPPPPAPPPPLPPHH